MMKRINQVGSKTTTCTFYYITKYSNEVCLNFLSFLAPSEPGDHEMEVSREKVLKWQIGTSGIGSDPGEENLDNSFVE